LCGNVGEQVNWDNFNNFIDTTKLYRPPASCNTVVIHQEFPAPQFFYTEPVNHRRISNFMNQLHEAEAIHIWNTMKPKLLDFSFKMHGSGGDDGMIDGLPQLAQAMRDSAFIFQVKHQGEGFGHVIHNAYAVGRPCIALKEFYIGKWAEHFLIDDYSAIILDDKNWDQLIERIRYWSEPDHHRKMCRNARKLFEKYVDFNVDEKKFRKFIQNLK
jgi:glycosyltransferase involved in cell wall biosynthesis